MDWKLDWYYFGDSTCLTTGSYDGGTFVRKLVDDDDGPGARATGPGVPQKGDVEARLRALFKSRGHPRPDEAPLLGWIRKAVRASTRRRGFPWDSRPIKGLDVQIAQGLPNRRGFLLTPTVLYVPWQLFKDLQRGTKKLHQHLKDKEIEVPTVPDDAQDGHYMWVDAALDAGDVMATFLPDQFGDDPARSLGVMATLRKNRGWAMRDSESEEPPEVFEWEQGTDDVGPMDLGQFTLRIEPDEKRNTSYIESDGTKLTFVLRTGSNQPLQKELDDQPPFLFCPWPCGALAGCSP